MREVIEEVESNRVFGLGLSSAGDLVPGVEQAAAARDQIEIGAANAFDRITAFAERSAGHVDRFGAVFQRAGVGRGRIRDAERHAAGGGAVSGAKHGGLAGRFAVQEEVDAALLVTDDVAGRVPGGGDEAQLFEGRGHRRWVGTGEFGESEAVEAEGVLIVHAARLSCSGRGG